MEQLAVIGTSWRYADSEALARMTHPAEEWPGILRRLREEFQLEECALISTCNRVELSVVTPEQVSLEGLRARLSRALLKEPELQPLPLRAWGGEGAAEHLFLVTAGMDSARLGEREIAGQIRRAWTCAREAGCSGPWLDLIFEEALKVARRVHRLTGLGEGRESLSELAMDPVRDLLRSRSGAIGVVGVSPMTQRCARVLRQEGHRIYVFNRTRQRAEELAAELEGEAGDLRQLQTQPPALDALICATGSPEPVLRRPDLERLRARASRGGPLIVDMAIPPDVDPRDAEALELERLGMDRINALASHHRSQRQLRAADARLEIDRALDRLQRRTREHWMQPLLAAVQSRYRRTADQGLERLLRKELSHLTEADAELLRVWTQTLARRFAQLPSKGLRNLAQHHEIDSLRCFLGENDPELEGLLEGLIRAAPDARGETE